MKKIIFLLGGLISSLIINAQVISNFDGAIVFSDEDINGTARFNAMSGAFGALGGDLSASDINPAGLAVFNNTETAITLGMRNTDILTSYYGTNTNNTEDYVNMTQAGAVLIFDNSHNENWTKFAIGFNYALVKDFENNYIVKGNSGLSEFNGDPYLNDDNNPDNDIFYENVDGQFFGNYTNGQNEKFTISFAAQYNENLHIGLSIVTHKLDHYQKALFEESNNDGNSNLLDASLLQELYTYGQGVGLNIGVIAKPIQELRLGLALQTPTWYNLTEEFTEDLEILVSNDPQLFNENSGINFFEYDLVTPAKATASIAYLFGRDGLLSLDYTFKNYTNTKLKPSSEFTDVNNLFSNNLQNTSEVRVGAEWRLGKVVSLRGGYYYKESPFVDALDSDHIKGFSVGTGFKFNGKVKLDLAYQKSTHTNFYNFTEFSDAAELDIDNGKLTATLVIGL